MNPWWWVLIGLSAWLVAGAAAALAVGRVLWRRSEALVAPDPSVPGNPGQPAKTAGVRLWWVLQANKRRRQERLARHVPSGEV
jgi:hypothetical protein